MKKFSLSNIGLDKCLHVVCCFVIAVAVIFFCYGVMGDSKAVSGTIGGIAAMLTGVAKELFDFFRGGRVDPYDLLADFIGSLLAFGCAFLM